ncbi:Nucleolar protein 6 [Desmophyllum pertusum]|uniref:Nucleolar protein 6 n=1 Tax=Desmophyllum pertusum TaxID=174260 RepID=A0A9W9ZMW3_9CNID|nr:Nucleolar protein 6 [Desmophyllum pertusum]
MKRKTEATEDSVEVDNTPRKKAVLMNGGGHQAKTTNYKDSLYRPPTSEEINALKETENLFKSSLFRMQITELLSEVQPKKDRNKSLDEVLHELNTLLLSLPDGKKEHEVADHSWLPRGTKFPLPSTPSPVKGKFCFRRPVSVKVVGSYLLGTVTKPDLNVDIAVQMPKECFQPKDYLNLRYHHKRALYLCIIASHLTKSSLFESVQFSHMNGEALRPILLLKPKGKAGKQFVIKLHPCLSEGTFKPQRFSPNRNNIRQYWFKGEEGVADDGGDTGLPTPHYNTSVLSDMFLEQHLHHLYKSITDFQGMKDAVALIKVWLHQRELDQGQGCCRGFLVSMFISYLLSVKKINQRMSSYQILRVFLQFLGSTDWTKEGITMIREENEDSNMPSKADFHAGFDVVFVDPSGYLNLCAGMTVAQYRRLQHEARLCLECLDSSFMDGFEVLFMTSVPFTQAFDQFFTNSKYQRIRSGLGLGKRVEMLCVKPQAPCQWPVNKAPPSRSQSSVTLGLLLNSDHADTVLDTGPPADSTEATSFRAFWAEKRTICEQIIKHLLQRHGGVDPASLTYIGSQLDCVLQSHAAATSSDSGTGDEEAQRVIQVYNVLCKQIRALELPLSVNSLQGISPVFRGAEVFPPSPCFKNSKVKPQIGDEKLADNVLLPSEIKNTSWCPAMEVVLQFETSGKWPDDLTAIQHIKAAFHIRLAHLLKSECSLVTAASAKHVDVLKDGLVFRIKIMHYREMVLLQKNEITQDLKTDCENRVKELEREITHLPLLTSTLHGIQQQFSGFSGTVRLAKRWTSAQLLSDHVTEECIELLVASLFLSPAPFTPPRSHLVGFLRFLRLLSSTDWQTTPIILNLNNDISAEDYQEITYKFSHNRAQLPAIFISTPKDKFTSLWTKDKPSKQIVNRLSLLARESHAILVRQIETCALQPTDFKQIFRPPLDHYDVIIHLHSRLLPRGTQALDHRKPAIEPASLSRSSVLLPVTNFDPAQLYLEELKEAFSDVALFFHDVYGGDLIGVVWKPHSFAPTQFKVLHAQYKMPFTNPQTSDKSKQVQSWVIPNVSAILSDFQTIGEGLVKKIEVLNA